MVTNGEKLFVTLLSIRYATSTDQVRQIEDLLKNTASKKKKKKKNRNVPYECRCDIEVLCQINKSQSHINPISSPRI